MGQDLKAMRIAAGIKQSDAARALGIGVNTLWRYESGKTERQDARVLERMKALYAVPQKEAVE